MPTEQTKTPVLADPADAVALFLREPPPIRRRSATWIGTVTSIGTLIGAGHGPFCCTGLPRGDWICRAGPMI
jgi:hypothetical protein